MLKFGITLCGDIEVKSTVNKSTYLISVKDDIIKYYSYQRSDIIEKN